MSYAIGLVLDAYTSDYAIKVCHQLSAHTDVASPLPAYLLPATLLWAGFVWAALLHGLMPSLMAHGWLTGGAVGGIRDTLILTTQLSLVHSERAYSCRFLLAQYIKLTNT